MKRILHDRKLNNVGMSLVEVVIAMAILSVVILGVLHSFVYSARLNARSRERQQTTAAAQTVMEYFKAYSVQSVYDDFTGVSGSGFSLNEGNGTTCTGTPGGSMTFDIEGMKYEREPYDVRVSLSGHTSDAANVTTLNYEIPTQEHAAVYVGYAGMDAAALNGIADMVAQKWSDMESVSPDPAATSAPTVSHHDYEVDSSKIDIEQRDINVDISKDPGSGNYVAMVSCTYKFKVVDYPYTKADGTSDTFTYSDTYVADLPESEVEGHSKVGEKIRIFNKSTALESLTLYYYPAYRYVPSSGDPSAPVRVGADHININNSTDTRVKCYVYKQKNLAVSDSRLSTSENMYEVDLYLKNAMVYDDNLNTLLGGSDVDRIMDSKIHVHSIGTDPAKDIRYHGIGYAAVNTNYPTAGNNSPAIPTPVPSSDSSVKPTSVNQQIMYDIKIEIYKNGDIGGTVLNTLEGTIIE